jgi:hypothetical protein
MDEGERARLGGESGLGSGVIALPCLHSGAATSRLNRGGEGLWAARGLIAEHHSPEVANMRTVPILITALVAAALAPAANAHLIRADNWIDDFAVKQDGSLRGAVRALGPPSRVVSTSNITCRVSWRRLGIAMGFYNLGGADPCRPRYGRFSHAVARGAGWHTGRGLRVGDSVSRLRSLYPNARFRSDAQYGAGWWLVVRRTPFGGGGRYPGLLARIGDHRVKALVVRYPAGGD